MYASLSRAFRVVLCPWLCPCRYCLKLLNTSDFSNASLLWCSLFPASVSARSFPLTLAYIPTTVHTQESSKVDAVEGGSRDLNVRTTRPQHPRYRPRIDCKLSKRKKGKNEEKEKKIKKGGVKGRRLPSMP